MADEKITAERIRKLKGTSFPALTAYDFAMAKMVDECGVPLMLVGDSLGMVVLGYPDTTRVTVDEMVHHVRAVARYQPKAFLAADMPAGSYETDEQALATAKRLVEAGAEAVKAEGGREIVSKLNCIRAEGIEFIGHLGMLPQRVHEEGGYRVKGKVEDERLDLMADAKALEEAGAMGMVLELVKPDVAREVTAAVSIPTIGIGAGSGCDGQILVTTDLLGTSPDYIPKHVKIRPDLTSRMKEIIQEWKGSLTYT
ncbi:MAG: 3-methyl-2-oxobutanoate hydroxymethyltransferase [Limisphaerales bacterium]